MDVLFESLPPTMIYIPEIIAINIAITNMYIVTIPTVRLVPSFLNMLFFLKNSSINLTPG
ncbi:hypothetical protein D3C73_1054320 [compost metagenome]